MLKRSLISVLLVSSILSTVSAADDLSVMSLKQRLERIENLVSSDVLIQQSLQLDSIREEMASLRESIELQGYELETVKQRQRSLYLDMDRRLQSLEAGNNTVVGNMDSGFVPVPPPSSGMGLKPATEAIEMPVVKVDIDGKENYSQAFGFLKEGRYSKSISEFELFITQYPDSKFSDNAQYWLGEANYVSRNYKKALGEFQRLIAKFPNSSKIPGARLKIGYTYFELKNWSAAAESLQQAIKLYPGTAVAKKANDRLQRMKREGRK